MKKQLFSQAAMLALCTLLVISCRKSANNPDTPLTGTWNATQWVMDMNNNGVIDDSDFVINMGTSTDYEITVFTNDHKGTDHEHMASGYPVDTTINFTWSLSADKQWLTTTPADPGITSAIHIDTLSATEVIISYTSYSSKHWKKFKKQ